MTDHATCDRCQATLSPNEGFAFYSSSSTVGQNISQEAGAMLLCKFCTDEITSDDCWHADREAPEAIMGMAVLLDPIRLLEKIQSAVSHGIVDTCKAHGLDPEHARDKARELALRWWEDPGQGEAESTEFWRSALDGRSDAADAVCYFCELRSSDPAAAPALVFYRTCGEST